MKRVFTFLTLLLFCSFALLLSSPPPVYAQAQNWVDEDYATCMDQAIQTGDTCAPAFTSHQVSNLISNGVRLLVGPVPGITTNSQDQGYLRQMQEKSVIGGLSRTIALVYAYPPASLGPWLADVGQTLGFIPKSAHAQGIGFSGLAPLLPVWKAFRNIAYLMLAIVMIVIGFMVMLRKKIDPKTVVTVQNAIPRIVITLILITFSYAIVGFLIDLMYLVILFVVTVVGGAMKNTNIPELQAAFTAGGFKEVGRIFDPLNQTLGTPAVGVAVGASAGVAATLLLGVASIPIIIVTTVLAGMTGGAITGNALGVGAAVGAVSPLLYLIILLSLVITLFRIFMILLNAYIQIIISLIFGPIQLVADAIPGSNGFSAWLNNLILQLATFPLVISLILIGTSITSNITSPQFWSPPLVPKAPGSSEFVRALLGFGIIMMIPSMVNNIKDALKIKPAIPLTAGGITQPVGAAWGTATGALSQVYYLEFLTKGSGNEGVVGKLLGFLRKRQ